MGDNEKVTMGRKPTSQTKRTNDQTQGEIATPIPLGGKTEKMKIGNRKPRIPRVYRLNGIGVIGTGGRAVSIGPKIRVGAEIRGHQPRERVVTLKLKVKIRGVKH